MNPRTTHRQATGHPEPSLDLRSAAEANPEEGLAGSWLFDLLFDLCGGPLEPPHRVPPEQDPADSRADNARQR